MSRLFRIEATPVLVVSTVGIVLWVNAGTLSPPAGPVAATMKTLQQVEPRIPIGQQDVPYTITTGSSYYLSENIAGVGGATMIQINASDVTLDLMGFTIDGNAGVGTASRGISISTAMKNITIRNGVIRDCSLSGLEGGLFLNEEDIVIEDIRSIGNGGAGIHLSKRGVVRRCVAQGNGFSGIDALRAHITDCVAFGNAGDGISGGGLIMHCHAYQNGEDGIEVLDSAVVRDNVCDENGQGAGGGAGIHAVNQNNRIEGNTVSNNDRGIDVDVGGNLVIRNTAGQNTVEYDIVAGNSVGPIVTSATIAGSNNPHANYEI